MSVVDIDEFDLDEDGIDESATASGALDSLDTS